MGKKKKSFANPFAGVSNWWQSVNPDTKKGIWIIFLFAFALISVLSFFELAGKLGEFINNTLHLFLGWVAFIFPIVIVIIAILSLKEDEGYSIPASAYLGAALFLLSLTGLLHLKFISLEQGLEAIAEHRGGGYFGLVLGYPLFSLTGFWAGMIILAALLIMSFLIIFNTSLHVIFGPGKILGRIFSPIGEKISSLKLKKHGDQISEEEDSFSYQSFAGDDKDDDAEEEEAEEQEESHDGDNGDMDGTEGALMQAVPKEKRSRPRRQVDIPIKFLNWDSGKPTSGDIKANQFTIKKTLENFNVPVEMGETKVGPTVTQFTFKPADGIKLSKITNLNNDLALALAAHPIRIEAPIPGKSLVGVEVPNQNAAIVGLREILESDSFKTRKSNLMVSLGKDVAGKCWLADLAKMPHMLVAGATGSGKSVCLNTIIVSLLYQNGPDDLKFIMVDPKRVEFPVYNGIPHLISPVITDVKKTVNALRWAIGEMDRRFELLSSVAKRDIHAYNNYAEDKLPFIVIIIDELADLMAVAAADVEASIVRLSQMARAVGIHLVVATQRPSVDVITGLIKANITSRVAFSVASQTDSRTILDQSGAEKLLGRGDMLFMTAELSKPKRLQGALITEKEIQKIVDYLKEMAEPEYDETVTEKHKIGGGGVVLGGDNDEDEDELLPEAKSVIMRAGKASASLLQRRLKIAYARAARILDILEEQGFIGPADGAKPREVLASSIDGDIIEPSDEDGEEGYYTSAEEDDDEI